MDWDFGLTMMVMGMTITLVSLYLLGWIIRLLTRIFPYEEKKEKEK